MKHDAIRRAEANYASAMSTGVDHYFHAVSEVNTQKQKILGAIAQAEGYAEEALGNDDENTAAVYEALIASKFILEKTVETTPVSSPTVETEEFIELFKHGMEAFFEDELSFTDKASLFDMAWVATRPLGKNEEGNQHIRQARVDFIARVLDEEPEGPQATVYGSVDVVDFLKTAVWLYDQPQPDEVIESHSWSVDPRPVLRHNPTLPQYLRSELATIPPQTPPTATD